MTLPSAVTRRDGWFYASMAFLCAAVVILGFGRSFYLRAWFPEHARTVAQEPIFLWHGAAFTAWFALLCLQPLLAKHGALRWHRRLGFLGAAVAGSAFVLGAAGAVTAAGRPGGFLGAPFPPYVLLANLLAGLVLYAGLVAAAIVLRGDGPSHKRLVLLGSLSILDAAATRWPFEFASLDSPIPGFANADLVVFALLLPQIVWDLATLRRLHPATVIGSLAIVSVFAVRNDLGETQAWTRLAAWWVG